MRYILVFLLAVSCGKKTIIDEGVLPENTASALESSQLEEALTKIQHDFDSLGVKVDVHSIPYNVSTLDQNRAGVCVYDHNGKAKGIAIDHSVFEGFDFPRTDDLAHLYQVLLHEIGHCIFYRPHDDEWLKVPGKKIKVSYWPDHMPDTGDGFELSVMNTMGWFIIPTSIWPYYVKEVAGLQRISDWQQISEYAPVELLPADSPKK
jgi:hypothetical protein